MERKDAEEGLFNRLDLGGNGKIRRLSGYDLSALWMVVPSIKQKKK